MPLREKVQLCADQHGISIRQLEKQVHIANKSIATWNDHRPSVDKVVAVADFFGVSMDYLLDRDSYSDHEIELMSKFRLLDKAQKETILSNIDFLLSQNPVKKESAM